VLGLGPGEVLGLGLRLGLRLRLAPRDREPLGDALSDREPLGDTLGDALGDGDTDTLALGDGDPLGDAENRGPMSGRHPTRQLDPDRPGPQSMHAGGDARFQGQPQDPSSNRRPYPGQGPA
jgi:hypothetical protein